eukprot:7380827-Prymnesium_polylepis.1
MQLPTKGQWWSNARTQLSQLEQCDERGGRQILHVEHHLTVKHRCPYQSSRSEHGGSAVSGDARGRTPGSVNDVRHSELT